MISRMQLKLLAVALATAVIMQTPATAQAPAAANVDPSLYSGMRWRSIGPDRGGRSIAVAGSAARPSEYYFGAVGGGVWKTTDYGLTWSPVGDNDFRTTSVGALAIAPSNPDIV
jgi:hypothetical protein